MYHLATLMRLVGELGGHIHICQDDQDRSCMMIEVEIGDSRDHVKFIATLGKTHIALDPLQIEQSLWAMVIRYWGLACDGKAPKLLTIPLDETDPT